MKAASYLREDIRWAHSLLELVMQDVTPELAAWHPPGLANPIGATYAHAAVGEDVIVRQLLQGVEPLLGSSQKPVAWVLSALVISHLNNMTGEMSALKGVQGAKGYPW